MSNQIKRLIVLLTALLAALTLLTCGDNNSGSDEIDVSATITGISRIDSDYAYAEVRYNARGANIIEVGVMYSTTPGRLNPGAFDTHSGAASNTDEFGIVSGLPSVSGTFGADLSGLKHSTTYYALPYIKLDKATGDFYKGYFVPTNAQKEFETLADQNSSTSPAAVSATNVASVTYTSANLSAQVTAAGSPGFNDRGFCYGTAQNPMLGGTDNTCVRVSGTGIAFSEQISGLTENTTYYVCAYIANESFGTRYGTETNFRTLREAVAGERFKFTDERDGQEYWAVDIDGMIWMAENLNFAMASSWCYENFDFMCEDYGRLYTWDAAMEACPAGWHLPSRIEWADFVEVVGSNAGGKLKAESGWSTGNGTDDFGFTALPGGSGAATSFSGVGTNGIWWTATTATVDQNNINVNAYNRHAYAYNRTMNSSNSNVVERSVGRGLGYAVRCIRDGSTPTYTLTVDATDGGTVIRRPDKAFYNIGEQVTITAIQEQGYSFVGWTSGQTDNANSLTNTVIMTSDLMFTANFQAHGIFIDPRDQQSYRTVIIDGNTWMAENLNFITDNSWCYNNADSNCIKYGRLYTWDAAISACPDGWHLPTRQEWSNLVTFVDSAGINLKSESGWNDHSNGSSGNGRDIFGFSALPGGGRWGDGFANVGREGRWWTATENGRAGAWSLYMGVGSITAENDFGRPDCISVRCISD